MIVVFSHTLAFALELALLAGIARAALALIQSPFGYGAAFAGIVLVAGLWGWFAAPKSSHRLTGAGLLLFKIGAFAVGALAFAASDGLAAGTVFAALAGLHLLLASRVGVL